MVEEILDTVKTDCLVVGAGIAGCWTALKLLRKGINTTMIYYDQRDRGGRIGATALSAGAINTSPLTQMDYAQWVNEIGRGQVHNDVCSVTKEGLASELEQLKEFDPLIEINLGVALKSGTAKKLIEVLMVELEKLGGVIIDNGWVTKILADEETCSGVQYQVGSTIGLVEAGAIVIASGGYSSLFHGSVKTGTYGSIHGRFMQAGGKLSNTEFIFKHGYGQPDLGKLTPTEELPGVEIYDDDGENLLWLEEELFYGRGTNNHFQAFMTWRKSGDKKYYVDFQYRDFNRLIKRLLQVTDPENKAEVNPSIEREDMLKEKIYSFCELDKTNTFYEIIEGLVERKIEYTFEVFNKLKVFVKSALPADKQRIRQISYFSMGGILHHRFRTNLHNVYINGEVMHDYGAHRVGGLPWALYLCAGGVIANEIVALKNDDLIKASTAILDKRLALFDASMLQTIQINLQKYQENGLGDSGSRDFIQWLRSERKMLENKGQDLDDSYTYLLMAEAIMASSLARRESRGCFFRLDITEENFDFSRTRSVVGFDTETGDVVASLVDKSNVIDIVKNRGAGRLKMDMASEKSNAAFVFIKRHVHEGRGGNIALESDGVKMTYAQLNSLVEKYAHYLFISGITKGDRICLLLNDSADFVALFFACMQIGAIAVPLNTFCKSSDLLHFVTDSQARLLISQLNLLKNHDQTALKFVQDLRVVNIEDIDSHSLSNLTSYMQVEMHTPGFMLYTSGSTGKPKGALHRQSSLEFSAKTFAESSLGISEKDRLFSSSKLFFAYGLGNSLTFPLYFGATSVLRSLKYSPEEIPAVLSEIEPTIYFAIPMIYNALLGAKESVTLPSSIRLCVSAGEALPAQVARKWYEQTGVQLLDGIGSTEALHIFCVTNHCTDDISHLGKPVPAYEMRIVDDNGFDLPIGEVGNLLVKGPTVTIGYWQNDEATQKAIKNGWLSTGDRYLKNSDGEFVYVGRAGDTYKSSGLWVSAVEVENALRSITFIGDAAISVFQDKDNFYRAKAFVQLGESVLDMHGEDHLRSKIFSHLKSSLSKYKLPHSIEFVDALPRTSTGKVAKHELRQLAVSLEDAVDNLNTNLELA